jgi:hypothetical protein
LFLYSEHGTITFFLRSEMKRLTLFPKIGCLAARYSQILPLVGVESWLSVCISKAIVEILFLLVLLIFYHR